MHARPTIATQQRPPHIAAWALTSVSVAVILVLAVLPPFVGEATRYVLMQGFAAVCHQIPERSLHIHGMPLAVCHRCLGIYAGMLAGVLAYWPLHMGGLQLGRYAAYLLVGAVAVPGVDWLGDVLGLWVNTPASRSVTGGVLGVVAGGLLAYAILRDRSREPAPTLAPEEATWQKARTGRRGPSG